MTKRKLSPQQNVKIYNISQAFHIILINYSKYFNQGGPYLTLLLFYTGIWKETPMMLLWKRSLSSDLTLKMTSMVSGT